MEIWKTTDIISVLSLIHFCAHLRVLYLGNTALVLFTQIKEIILGLASLANQKYKRQMLEKICLLLIIIII